MGILRLLTAFCRQFRYNVRHFYQEFPHGAESDDL